MSNRDAPTALVRLERRGHVAICRIDNPKANALSIAVLDALYELVAELRAELPGALVITGAGRSFAAGADVSEVADASRVRDVLDSFRRTFDAVSAFPRVTIAAIAGYCLGGGCELALSCDVRFAATDARLGLPEVGLGLFPGAGGTQRLSRLVGPAVAKDLIFSGRQLDAESAFRCGVVTKVVDAASLLDEAIAYGEELAAGPLVAIELAKRAIDEGLDLPLDEALDLERSLFEAVRASEDAAIGLTSFVEFGPGKAKFVGR